MVLKDQHVIVISYDAFLFFTKETFSNKLAKAFKSEPA